MEKPKWAFWPTQYKAANIFITSKRLLATFYNASFPSTISGNHRSSFCHCRLNLPFLEFHVNGIRQSILFGVCPFSLKLMILRFIYLVASSSGSCLLLTELYFVVWMYHFLFISLVDGLFPVDDSCFPSLYL